MGIVETFTAPLHRVDAVLACAETQQERALTVYAAIAGTAHFAGDVAECGVGDGQTAREIRRLLDVVAPNKTLHLFDAFGTTPLEARNSLAARAVESYARPAEEALATIAGGPTPGVIVHIGLFKNKLPVFQGRLSCVHADADLYESTREIIALADRCTVPGGVMVCDDWGSEWTGTTKALAEGVAPERWATYAVAGYCELVAVRKR